MFTQKRIIASIFMLLIHAHVAFAGSVQLAKTGQAASYAAGDDGSWKKGVAVSGSRFTDNGNGTVTDNLTGLAWLQNANCFGTKSWQQAVEVSKTLSSGSCGLSDGSAGGEWRLPNVDELESLVDLSRSAQSLTAGHPFKSVQAQNYWSSSSYASSPASAWGVNMEIGSVYNYGKKGQHNVWPVRYGRVAASAQKTAPSN